jgi:hypothetical protein
MTCLSGSQNVTVAEDVHCSQSGSKVTRQRAQKHALSARTSSEPSNLYEIVEDSDFTAITTRKEQCKTKIKPTITDTAINTALASSPALESHIPGSSEHNKNQFATASRQKIPPVVIDHHFQGDMTRLNKDFHSKFQPIGFTTHTIKAGIARQT